MKILIVQDRLRSGGTERQSILLSRAFAAAQHPTTLLTFRPQGALASTVDPAVTRIVLQPFDVGLDWFAPGLLRTVRHFAPDVVLCMGRMANCYAGRLVGVRSTAAIVATMRTGKPLPILFRRSLRRVTHIVANSHDARSCLVSAHHIEAAKISVIHNSLVFPAPFASGHPDSSRDTLRARHGATAATNILLNVAMFRPEKNQRELLHLAAALPATADWHLWLAGDGPTRAACERLAARLSLMSHVRFVGFHRDPAPLYAAADVAVHTSASESLSNFLIEAQAHGLPAVAYAAQGIAECFVPGHTGWAIPSNDRAAFLAALTPLLVAAPAERSVRAASARAFARTTFDPARQSAAYLDLFSRLISTLRS